MAFISILLQLTILRPLFFFFLTLQNCISFAKYQNESATGIIVFPILDPPPSSLPIPSLWVVPCTSPKHPVSCIEPGLASHFIHDILHVSNHLFILNLSGERPFRYRSFLIEIPHLSSKVSFTVKLGQLVQESCKYQNDIARILLD